MRCGKQLETGRRRKGGRGRCARRCQWIEQGLPSPPPQAATTRAKPFADASEYAKESRAGVHIDSEHVCVDGDGECGVSHEVVEEEGIVPCMTRCTGSP